MGKHHRVVPEQKSWYKQTMFIAGIIGIVLLAALFFLITVAFKDGGKQSTQTAQPDNLVPMENGYQVMRMAVNGIYYEPSSFTVKQGVPVKFIVDGSKASGCTSIIQSRDLGFSKQLTKGENVIEFTPQQKGTYVFACGMNMVQGTVTVV